MAVAVGSEAAVVVGLKVAMGVAAAGDCRPTH